VPWPLHTSSVVCHHSVIVHNMTCAMSFVDFFFFFFFFFFTITITTYSYNCRVYVVRRDHSSIFKYQIGTATERTHCARVVYTIGVRPRTQRTLMYAGIACIIVRDLRLSCSFYYIYIYIYGTQASRFSRPWRFFLAGYPACCISHFT